MVSYSKAVDNDLEGKYYIGIYSIAECTFTINTFILKNEEITTSVLMQTGI